MDVKYFVELCYYIQTRPILHHDTRLFPYYASFSKLIWSMVVQTTNEITVPDMIYSKIRKEWFKPATSSNIISDSLLRYLVAQPVVNYRLLNVTLQYGSDVRYQSEIVSTFLQVGCPVVFSNGHFCYCFCC